MRSEDWLPIESAPKQREVSDRSHHFGPNILLYPVFGEVARGRWWETDDGISNFLADGGRAVFPTHWMPLPEPPAPEGQ